jgi:hypothetical protein
VELQDGAETSREAVSEDVPPRVPPKDSRKNSALSIEVVDEVWVHGAFEPERGGSPLTMYDINRRVGI